jgi:hypothetical protein
MSEFTSQFFNTLSKLPGLSLPAAPLLGAEQAQASLANFSRACGHVTRGMMAASVAQMELTRSLYAVNPSEWTEVAKPGASREAIRHWLHQNETKFESAVHTYRRINDELIASFFEAADSLMENAPAVIPAQEEASADGKAVEAPSAAGPTLVKKSA